MRSLLFIIVLSLSFSSACSEAPSDAPPDEAASDAATPNPPDLTNPKPPVFLLEFVDKSDPSGKVTATCPEGSRVVGGGCDCDSNEQILYRARILVGANGYECGCFDGAVMKRGATAQAACIR